MNRKKLNIRLLASAGLIMLALASCQDAAWDDHYGAAEDTASASLMEELSSRSEFSDFVALLKQTGGDSILNYNQTFTVFAPTNEALSGLTNNGNAMAEVVQNHVARYLFGPSNLVDTAYLRVKMLNGKYQELTRSGDKLLFAGIDVTNAPIMAINGIIYPISTRAGYYDNIWELLSNGVGRYDSLYNYIARFNDTTTVKSSVEVGENSRGQKLYFHNRWMKKYGSIHLEDSLYTAFLPTNTGWKDAFKNISPYFRTFGKMTEDKTPQGSFNFRRSFETNTAESDSLQDTHTREAIARDLLFRRRPDFIAPAGDTLTTTSGNTYHHPAYLIEGLTAQTASNGQYYSVDKLPHKPADHFLKEIKVEAEKTVGREFLYSTLTNRSAAEGNLKDEVSNMSFLEVVNTSTNNLTPPQVVFNLPDVLAAKYNIYAVFVPAQAFDTLAIGYRQPETIICERDTIIGKTQYHAGDEAVIQYPYYDADSTKVCFYLSYVHEKPNSSGYNMYRDNKIEKDPDTGEFFITKGYEVTKFLVARNFQFPYANYTGSAFSDKDAQTGNTKICVSTNLTNADKQKMGYVMRIDYLILEPVIE
ncbi:MAG: fasciclin domain-containing protein [Prevotella sp.]|nr:fasciclin domain-containing protein [Prevotella sp.]